MQIVFVLLLLWAKHCIHLSICMKKLTDPTSSQSEVLVASFFLVLASKDGWATLTIELHMDSKWLVLGSHVVVSVLVLLDCQS